MNGLAGDVYLRCRESATGMLFQHILEPGGQEVLELQDPCTPSNPSKTEGKRVKGKANSHAFNQTISIFATSDHIPKHQHGTSQIIKSHLGFLIEKK